MWRVFGTAVLVVALIVLLDRFANDAALLKGAAAMIKAAGNKVRRAFDFMPGR